MNRTIHNAAVAAALALALGLTGCNGQQSQAAGTADQPDANAPHYADVISATPIRHTVSHPTQKCHDETVTHQKPVKDSHQIAGTAIGAVVGGVLGHQVGGGKGKKIATVAGAIGGGYAGKKIQEHEQKSDTYTTTEHKCQTVANKRTVVVGYTVKYRYQGEVHTTRMDHKPGRQIAVRQVLSTRPVKQ
jgi:uncharacterized protein YcfJ